ncbi:tRNA pseudouridine(38-40) synthase TruA [Novipirellula maiorica]|uniref:tRNA pseudouridine(38-40) synthase TruA n=1 Tax=Novipirellula maiorica TaxID=1265734 RepID=UPI000349F557|nr:tRNA pseudouridine(38-40) synthase TruA [Rhodopirellula maiorica]
MAALVDRTFKLTIAYDGTDYSGWQIQPQKPTIQGMLERALVKLTRQRVHVTGSGRTDAGVHALAQVASLRTPNWRASATDLLNAMNVNLPPTIVVTDAVDAPDDFHAIRDAIGKRYRYQVQVGGQRSVFDYRYRWHLYHDIDLDAVSEAAARFEGKHDFASFQAVGSPRKTTTRNVKVCEIIREPSMSHGGILFSVEIEADGFLYNMVRNIVGTLIEVGKGKYPPQHIDNVIEAANRDAAGPTAPPQALFLKRVDYLPFA